MIWFIGSVIAYLILGVIVLSILRWVIGKPIFFWADPVFGYLFFWPFIVLFLIEVAIHELGPPKPIKQWRDWIREPEPEWVKNPYTGHIDPEFEDEEEDEEEKEDKV